MYRAHYSGGAESGVAFLVSLLFLRVSNVLCTCASNEQARRVTGRRIRMGLKNNASEMAKRERSALKQNVSFVQPM